MRDERSARCGAATRGVSGKVGVCDAAFGVGVLKLPSGLAEAYNSSIPVLGILSNAPRDWMVWNERGSTAQGVEQVSPFTPITKGTFRVASQATVSDTVRYSFNLRRRTPGPGVFTFRQMVFKEAGTDAADTRGPPHAGRFPAWRAHRSSTWRTCARARGRTAGRRGSAACQWPKPGMLFALSLRAAMPDCAPISGRASIRIYLAIG